MLHCFIILTPPLSEDFLSFALYVFHNDSNFLTSLILSQKREFYQDKHLQRNWKAFKRLFRLKPSVQIKRQKAVKFETFPKQV